MKAADEELLRQAVQKIGQWQSAANWALGLTIAAFVFGLLVGALQGGSQPWYKKLTLGLGLAIALITGIKPLLFPADYRVLQRSCVNAGRVVVKLQRQLSLFDPTQSRENLNTFDLGFAKTLHEIEVIEDSLLPDTTVKDSGMSDERTPVVHAQSAASPPSVTSRKFNGVASDSSLKQAQDSAQLKSVRAAAETLLKQEGAKVVDPPQTLLDLITYTSEKNSSFDYDRAKRLYTVTASIQLSKVLEHIDLQRYLGTEKVTLEGVVQFAPLVHGRATGVLVTARSVSDFRNARTVEDGRFEFVGIPKDRWDVVASANGYCQQEQRVAPLAAYRATLPSALILSPRCVAGWTDVEPSSTYTTSSTVRARGATPGEGDFSFHLNISRSSGQSAKMTIDWIEVDNDGGAAKLWSFRVYINNVVALTIPRRSYSKSVRQYKSGLASQPFYFPTGGLVAIRIVGEY